MDDIITRETIAIEDRINFLPNYTGNHFLAYETAVYDRISQSVKNYTGGFWEFYALSNGGFYMAPVFYKPFAMTWDDNYYSGTMSADAAGIAVNLCVQSDFAFGADADRFSPLFHKLRDYMSEHAEAGEILGYID